MSAGGAEDHADEAVPGAPRSGGSIAVGLLDEPVTLNPYVVVNGIVDSTITNAVNDPLIQVMPDGTLAPVLARRVPSLQNGGIALLPGGGMRMTVELHPAAAWSDGEPLECDDVRFTWQTITDERWVIATRRGWEDVSRIDCPTPKRAVLHFRTIYGGYVDMLRNQVLPRHDLEGDDFDRAWLESVPVSSGPFRFAAWRRGTKIVLERNDRYWNAGAEQLPRLERIEYRFFADPNTLAVELSTGDIDVIGRQLTAPLETERRTFPRGEVLATPLLSYQGFSFNVERDHVSELRVRQAIAYALDRRELVDAVMREPFEVLDSTLVPENGPYHAVTFDRYRPDAERVRTLLEQAGYERRDDGWYRDGERLALTFKAIGDRGLRMKVAQLVQDQLGSHGIHVDVILETPQVFFGTTLRNGAWDMIFWGMGIGLDVVQRGYLHCEPSPGRTNASRWCDAEATRLIDRASAQLDGPGRVAAVRRLHEIVAEQVPAIPLFQDRYETVLTPRVQGLRPSALGTGLGWDAEHWWVSG